MKAKTHDQRYIFLFGTCLVLLINFLFSCGTARRGEPVMGKLMARNEQVNRGEIIFMNNCESCHPGGEAGVGPPIHNVLLPGGLLRFRVRSKAFILGLGRMPSFKKHEISREQMDDLIVYLKTVKKNDEDAHGSTRGNKNFAKK